MPRDGLITNSCYIFLQASGLDTDCGPRYRIRASGLNTGYGFRDTGYGIRGLIGL